MHWLSDVQPAQSVALLATFVDQHVSTFNGALSAIGMHADPAADWPTVLMAFGSTVELAGPRGTADDLKKLTGVSGAIEKKLNDPVLLAQFEQIGPQATQQEADRWMRGHATSESPYYTSGSDTYMKWSALKLNQQQAEAEWKQLPRAEAKRKVAADIATDEAARSEKAAVDNQRFITDTGRDVGEQRSLFDVHHRAGQEIVSVQQNTSLVQAVAKARESVKMDEAAILKAMEHSTGFSAEALKKIGEHANTLADLEKRMRQQEGRPPRL